MEYQPHAQTTIEFRKECTDEESKIGLLFRLSEAYEILGKYEESEQMHRETLELKEKVLGQENPSTLFNMNNLALVLDSQGKYNEAKQMHWETLELKEKVLGQENPFTLNGMNNLAEVLKHQGKYK